MQLRSHFFKIMLAGLAAGQMVSIPASATELTAASAVSPGHALASVLASEDRQISNIDPLLDSLFSELTKSSPEIATLEELYPGIDKAWKGAMRPILISEVRNGTPGYHQELSDFFTANLTNDEILEIAAFYSSSTGQALINSLYASIDFKNISSEIAAEIDSEEANVSTAAINKDVKSAATSAAKSLNIQQRTEVARFMLSPTGRKFTKLIPQKQTIDSKWFNREPDAAAMKKIEKDIPAALDAFIEKADKQKSK